MPAKKIVIKKREISLKPRVMQRVILSEDTKPGPSQTLHIDDPDDEDVIDNSASAVVALNSSTLKDLVEQRPLQPEEEKVSPQIDLTLDLSEPTFKFFCYRCGQKLKVPISWAHLSTTCGRCGHDLVVPPPIAGQED